MAKWLGKNRLQLKILYASGNSDFFFLHLWIVLFSRLFYQFLIPEIINDNLFYSVKQMKNTRIRREIDHWGLTFILIRYGNRECLCGTVPFQDVSREHT